MNGREYPHFVFASTLVLPVCSLLCCTRRSKFPVGRRLPVSEIFSRPLLWTSSACNWPTPRDLPFFLLKIQIILTHCRSSYFQTSLQDHRGIIPNRLSADPSPEFRLKHFRARLKFCFIIIWTHIRTYSIDRDEFYWAKAFVILYIPVHCTGIHRMKIYSVHLYNIQGGLLNSSHLNSSLRQ